MVFEVEVCRAKVDDFDPFTVFIGAIWIGVNFIYQEADSESGFAYKKEANCDDEYFFHAFIKAC